MEYCQCKKCTTYDFTDVTIDELLGVIKVKDPRKRNFKWMKRTTKGTVSGGWTGGELIFDNFDNLGLELAEGHAAFDDGGRYVVLETTEGLEWTILDVESNRSIKRVKLDSDEAVAQCKLLNQSEKEIWGTTQKAPTPKTRQGFFRRSKAV